MGRMNPNKYPGLKADGRLALRAHLVGRAREARERHGPVDGRAALEALLADRECVRFEARLAVDPGAPPLGQLEADGEGPRFAIRVRPELVEAPGELALVVATHRPRVSYGRMPDAEDGEVFAAELLGVTPEEVRGRLERAERRLTGDAGANAPRGSARASGAEGSPPRRPRS